MKFLHVSDLHFHRCDKDNKATIGALGFVAQNYPDHHLVITGDITDDGHVEQAVATSLWQ
jgi:3',5'-cyclic AMP phosphodiesterase CpdA